MQTRWSQGTDDKWDTCTEIGIMTQMINKWNVYSNKYVILVLIFS